VNIKVLFLVVDKGFLILYAVREKATFKCFFFLSQMAG
jgi:hypothetical protein